MTKKGDTTPSSKAKDTTRKSKFRKHESTAEKSKSAKEKEKEEEKAAPVSNYWRILSFGTKLNHCILLLALVTAAASGTALPLMNIFFGRLVGAFNGYFIPGSGVTKSEFKSSVNRNALYIVYLFVGKFILTYIAMVCSPVSPPFQLTCAASFPFEPPAYASLPACALPI
jgi:ATP-binding cassette, subfamily B (MDR/TAP), member 1